MTGQLIQMIAAYTSVLGFVYLFRVKPPRLWYAALGGLLTWGVYLLMRSFLPGIFGPYFCASVFATIFAEVMARKMKSPVTVFLVSAEIILIPGGNLYYAMSYAVSGRYQEFTAEGMKTLTIALALAAGILVVSTLVPYLAPKK